MYGEDALSGIYDINPGGTITMPLVGSIVAAGRTSSEVERALTRAYASGKFLQEPQISIWVVSYLPFYIFGEVTTPGRYAYTSGLNVLTAYLRPAVSPTVPVKPRFSCATLGIMCGRNIPWRPGGT